MTGTTKNTLLTSDHNVATTNSGLDTLYCNRACNIKEVYTGNFCNSSNAHFIEDTTLNYNAGF